MRQRIKDVMAFREKSIKENINAESVIIYYKALREYDEAFRKKHPFKHWLYSGNEFRIPIFVYSVTIIGIILLYTVFQFFTA